MASTGTDDGWQWPEDLPGQWREEHRDTPRTRSANSTGTSTSAEEKEQSSASEPNPQEQRRYYRPRTCRICLETVLPKFEPSSESLPGVFQSRPSVIYESEEGGRLIRPCLCKGSQKYVHEGCLNSWRLADPLQKRNYWQCPTCRYSYRLERMAWGRWIGSAAAQISLTVLIFLIATFTLGYVADPIINLYLDPYDTIVSAPTSSHGSYSALYEELYEEEPDGWIEHFLKGFASLGLLGFAKFLLTLSPWQWWNVRNSGMMGGGGARAGVTGRDRLQQISWITVLVGIITVLWAVWKGVRSWSRRTLEKASERVMDVPGSDNDDDEE